MTHFIKALQEEIAGLEASLKAQPDPRLVKIHELQRVLSLYNGEANATASSPASRAPIGEPGKARRGRQPDPMRQAAIEAAREILAPALGPMKTAELYKRLAARGITLAGNLPANNLSALLFHHPDFYSQGRSGWMLKSSDSMSENEKPADDISGEEESAGLSDPSNEHSRDAMQGGGT